MLTHFAVTWFKCSTGRMNHHSTILTKVVLRKAVHVLISHTVMQNNRQKHCFWPGDLETISPSYNYNSWLALINMSNEAALGLSCTSSSVLYHSTMQHPFVLWFFLNLILSKFMQNLPPSHTGNRDSKTQLVTESCPFLRMLYIMNIVASICWMCCIWANWNDCLC